MSKVAPVYIERGRDAVSMYVCSSLSPRMVDLRRYPQNHCSSNQYRPYLQLCRPSSSVTQRHGIDQKGSASYSKIMGISWHLPPIIVETQGYNGYVSTNDNVGRNLSPSCTKHTNVLQVNRFSIRKAAGKLSTSLVCLLFGLLGNCLHATAV